MSKKMTDEEKAERKKIRAEKKVLKEEKIKDVEIKDENKFTGIQSISISVESEKEVRELGKVAPYDLPRVEKWAKDLNKITGEDEVKKLEETREERIEKIKENKFIIPKEVEIPEKEAVGENIQEIKERLEAENKKLTEKLAEILGENSNGLEDESLTTHIDKIKPAVSFAGPNTGVTVEKITKTEEEKKNSPAATQSPEDSLKINKSIPTRKTDARGVIMMGGRIIKTS